MSTRSFIEEEVVEETEEVSESAACGEYEEEVIYDEEIEVSRRDSI